MKSFLEWMSDPDNFQAWRALNEHLLKRYKGGSDMEYYNRLVRLLRNVGLDQEANEFLMIMPTQEELDFGKQPMGNNWKKNDSHAAMYDAVLQHLGHFEELVEKKYEEMGWSFEDA